MEGTLSKWTNVMKGWQYRYFVLDDNAGLFSYYTSREKMMRGARRGCVRLRGALIGIDDEDDATFTITVDGKSFYFQARNMEEREKWIRSLEDTVLRHNQMRRTGGQPKSTRAKLSSGSGEPPTIQDFDKKLAETDSYLQLLLNQVSGLKTKIDLSNSDANLPVDSSDNNGDVFAAGDNGEGYVKNLRKMRYEDIANKAVGMTESIKHAIVLLQIAKNASAPQTDNQVKTFKAGQSPDLLNNCGTGDMRSNQTQAAASPVHKTYYEDKRNDISPVHLATSGLSCEKAKGNQESDIQMGDRLPETNATGNLGMKPEQDGLLSGSGLHFSDKRKSSLKLVQQIIPDESYESDSDDEFYDANDVEELDGGRYPAVSSQISPTAIVRPQLCLDLNAAASLEGITNPRSIVSPLTPEVDDNDENIDYDNLYETEEDEGDLDMKSHGSVITHLLSQVRIGMDLTKIVLPTFILERRSLLEMYSDFFAHPDLFLDIPDGNSPEERMIRALKWYLSSFHAGRKSSIAKKPYNPILGETFRCHWKPPSKKSVTSNVAANTESDRCPKEVAKESALPECGPDELTFIAEQVSHHPPISAFYAEHVNKRISTCAHIYTKSSFLGMSIGVHNVGEGKITLLDFDEEYVATFPSAYARSILSVPWIELGGKCEIQCPKTGYSACLEFKCKPFFSSDMNKVSAEVFAPNTKKPILKVDGEWNGKMMAKWAGGKNEVFIDVNKLPIYPKLCKPVTQQSRTESRRLWKNVTYNLKENNIDAATSGKFTLEQQQRMDAAKRKEDGVKWETTFFTPESDGGSSCKWNYNSALKDRIRKS